MKKLFFLTAAFFTIAAHAQKIVTPYTTITLDPNKVYTVRQSCDTTFYSYIDTLQQAYYKDSIYNHIVTVPQTCTDTTGWNVTPVNCYTYTKGWFRKKTKTVCPDTLKTPITATRDCSYTGPKSDTLHNYFYFPAITKQVCDTSIDSLPDDHAKFNGTIKYQPLKAMTYKSATQQKLNKDLKLTT